MKGHPIIVRAQRELSRIRQGPTRVYEQRRQFPLPMRQIAFTLQRHVDTGLLLFQEPYTDEQLITAAILDRSRPNRSGILVVRQKMTIDAV